MTRINRLIVKQWNDIKGNVKYGVLWFLLFGSGSSGLVAWVTSYIQKIRGAAQQDRIGYAILAATIFLDVLASIFLFLVLISRNGLAPMNASVRWEHEAVETSDEASSVPTKPLPVDLRGEFLELYTFSFDRPQLMLATLYVLAKVRIVNYGPDEAAITNASLQVQMGSYQETLRAVGTIPDRWRIKRRREGTINPVFDELTIGPSIGSEIHQEVYRKGHPREGWMAFEHIVMGNFEYPNARFDLILEDSLGGIHHIVREAGVYGNTGEIVYASVPNVSTS